MASHFSVSLSACQKKGPLVSLLPFFKNASSCVWDFMWSNPADPTLIQPDRDPTWGVDVGLHQGIV